MTIRQMGIMLCVQLLICGKTDGFVNVAPALRCSHRAAAATVSLFSLAGGGGDTSVTRTEAIKRSAAGSAAAAAAAAVLWGADKVNAEADVEVKDEVQQFAELRGQVEKRGRDEVTKENLALLSEATAALKTLESFVGEKDYQGLRLALRNPPISNLRSSARKVIINIDDKEAEQKATTAYKAMISSVDKLDSIANRGMKAKAGLKDDSEFREVYGTCIERGSDLMALLPKIL